MCGEHTGVITSGGGSNVKVKDSNVEARGSNVEVRGSSVGVKGSNVGVRGSNVGMRGATHWVVPLWGLACCTNEVTRSGDECML